MGVGMGTRGRSHANAAVTIQPGASAPGGGRGWNKALAFSTCEKPAFLGPEAEGAAPLRIHTPDHTERFSSQRLQGSFQLSFDPGDAYEM